LEFHEVLKILENTIFEKKTLALKGLIVLLLLKYYIYFQLK